MGLGRRRSRRGRRVGRWAAGLAVVAAAAVGTATLVAHPAPAAGARLSDAALSESARAALAASRPSTALPSPAVPRGYRPPAAVPPPAVAPPPSAVPAPGAAASPSPAAPGPATPARSVATAPRSAPAAAPAPRGPVAVPMPAPAPRAAPVPGAVPAGSALPLPVPVGASTQVVTVVAPSARATTATLTAWQKGSTGWTVAAGPVAARIGAQGVGVASETTSRTPAGTFALSEAFGRLADPGTRLPYRTIDGDDYWVSDVASPAYNQFAECPVAACPFDTSAGEHLLDAGSSYDYAAVIDYNRGPVRPGAGSAFFLHVSNGLPTAGCVAIPRATLLGVLRWLDPSARPLISIGVG